MISLEKGEIFKLPLVGFTPFLAAGMLIAYFSGSFAGGIIFAAAAAFCIFLSIRKLKAAVCAGGLAFGILIMLIFTAFYSAPIMKMAGESICAEVKVTEITENSGDLQEFIGQIRFGIKTANVRLSGTNRVEEGDIITAKIELENADNDKELMNFAKGILLSGNISEYVEVKKSAPDLKICIEFLRGNMLERLRENLFGDCRELALSMFFGKDEGLSQMLSEQIKISGVSHFTVVSGAHFAVLASVLLSLFPEKNRRRKAIFSLFIMPCALIFFGASLSVMRSMLMFLIMSAAPLFRRTSNPLNSLCAAVCIILIANPQAILDIGFAMSVLGFFGAGVAGPQIAQKVSEFLPEKAKIVSPIISVFFSSFCAVVCTAPISAAVFKGVSLCAVLASILIMPLLAAGMTFMILLGLTGAGFFAVPLEVIMKIILAIINFFGGKRLAFLNLDYSFAWIFAAICVVFVAVAAFGNMKTLRRCGAGFAVFAAASVGITLFVNANRNEIRFIGNSTTSAAVVLHKNEADVFISGNGVGLADDISRCLRERGAYKIDTLTALDADFCGELALSELSKLAEINTVFLSENYSKLPAKTADKNSIFSINGITIASANVSDRETNADIVLYHGSITKPPQSSAKLAVYFTNSIHELPQNSVNIYRRREYYVKLVSESVTIKLDGKDIKK